MAKLKKIWDVGFWAKNEGKILKKSKNPVVTTIDRMRLKKVK